MRLKELDQRAVQTCAAQGADPDDHPQVVSRYEAEGHADQDGRHIAGDPGILERESVLCHFLDDRCHAVVGCDPHISRHIECHAQSGTEAAQDHCQDTQRQGHLHMPDVLEQPADQVGAVSHTDHIDDGPGADAAADCEEYDHQDEGIGDQLPGAESHADVSADPQVHAGKGIHAEPAQPKTAYTDTDK